MTLCHLLQEAGRGGRWGSRSGKSCKAHFRLDDQWNLALCSSRVMLGALQKHPTPVPYFPAWLSCYMGTWPRRGRPSQEIINKTLLWSLAKHASSSSLHLCCRSNLYSSHKTSAWPLKWVQERTRERHARREDVSPLRAPFFVVPVALVTSIQSACYAG